MPAPQSNTEGVNTLIIHKNLFSTTRSQFWRVKEEDFSFWKNQRNLLIPSFEDCLELARFSMFVPLLW